MIWIELFTEDMHPLVRRLYKEALYVGRDYPLGVDKVRLEWKKAIRNPENCPSCYNFIRSPLNDGSDEDPDGSSSVEKRATVAVPKGLHSEEFPNPQCERELRKAVGKGRYMIREMIGVIQLKKYRTLKQRYSNEDKGSMEMLHKTLSEINQKDFEHLIESGDDLAQNQKDGDASRTDT